MSGTLSWPERIVFTVVLAMVLAILAGTIWAASTGGRRTTVTITVPSCREGT